MRKKLTEQAVTRFAPPEAGRLEILDSITPGFGLRVTPQGTRTYFVLYRIKGERRLQRLTLGKADDIALGDARKAAKAALELAIAGHCPKVARETSVASAKAEDVQTVADRFEEVAKEYVARHAKPNLRQWRAVDRNITRELVSRWKGRSVHSITRRDVVTMLDEISDRPAPIMANRIHALTCKLFAWAMERGVIDRSPAAGIKKPNAERTRDRVLTDEEIAKIWKAAEVVGYPGGPLVRLLLLSAARLNEIAQLTKAQIDGDELSLAETKNGRPHLIPITPLIRAALDELPAFKGEYILTSTAGDRPMQNFTDIKIGLDEKSGVTDWRYHDLRRTAASGMARLGIPPHVIEAVLNHSSGAVSGVARVYNRFDYAPEKRAALERWGAEVLRIAAGRKRVKVVGLRP